MFKMKKSNSLKINIQLLIIILFLSSNISCRKNVQETNSSFEVIEKLIGDRANEFELSLVEKGISDSEDWFEVESKSNSVKN